MGTHNWFGPSKREIWNRLAEDIGASYTQGGIGKPEKLQVVHDQWTVTLDSMVVMTGDVPTAYTRFRAPFINPEAFRFRIFRRNFLTGIQKMFGMQDIEIGHPEFDNDFVIQSNNETKIRELLANDRICEILNAERTMAFAITDDEGWFGARYPKDTDALVFSASGEIKDMDRLKRLFDLFAETLDEMCRIGTAYRETPELKL